MGFYSIDSEQNIKMIIEHLVTNEVPIEVHIEGENAVFTSKFIEIDQRPRNAPPRVRGKSLIIVKRLAPDSRNALIQSIPEVVLGFRINGNRCWYAVRYVGMSNMYPYFGYMVDFPECIKIREKRREQVYAYEMPEVLFAELSRGSGRDTEKIYDLNLTNLLLI